MPKGMGVRLPPRALFFFQDFLAMGWAGCLHHATLLEEPGGIGPDHHKELRGDSTPTPGVQLPNPKQIDLRGFQHAPARPTQRLSQGGAFRLPQSGEFLGRISALKEEAQRRPKKRRL